MTLPRSFTRVSWIEMAPHVTTRNRNYERAEDAAAQVAAIGCWPDRAHLIGVWTTECDWTETDPASLPLSEDDRAKYDTLNESETP